MGTPNDGEHEIGHDGGEGGRRIRVRIMTEWSEARECPQTSVGLFPVPENSVGPAFVGRGAARSGNAGIGFGAVR